MLDGFKKFILRGNVVDLAVGVIIGAAFAGLVSSMTKDLITPMIGLAGGIHDFSGWKLGPFGVGSFINAVVTFFIQASVVYFCVVLPLNRLMALAIKKQEPAPAPPSREEVLLTEIRDLLKAR